MSNTVDGELRTFSATDTVTVMVNRPPTSTGTIETQAVTVNPSKTIDAANYFTDPDDTLTLYGNQQ